MKFSSGLSSYSSVLIVAVAALVATPPAPAVSGSGDHLKGEPANSVSVTVHPMNAPVTSMVTQQFTATVTGTSNHGVTWFVAGVKGGNSTVGTISSTGLYTPPSTFSNGKQEPIKAVSTEDDNASGVATVYLVTYAGQVTNKNDNERTGQDLQEAVLNGQNVNVNTFGKIFSYTIDGPVQAQPLYVANVNIPNPLNGSAGYHNVVFIATENDSVYAFDADGKVTEPLWYDPFADPPSVTPVPGACVYTTGEWGITPTPVIDPTTNTIYVEVRTLENATSQCAGTYVQRLHALDITTGEEKFGGPVQIEASVKGTGIGNVNGVISFDPHWENSRPGLLESQSSQDPNPIIYMGAASLEDTEPYHGWVLGFDSQTLALKYVFNSTVDGSAGGVWQMGAGIAADTEGNLYAQTGNGTFDDVDDFGLSVLKLKPNNGSLVLVDSYTPSNYPLLNQQDWDVSSGGILLLPEQPGNVPHVIIGGGKEGTIYVMNRDDLGGFHAGENNILQYIVGAIRASVPGHQPYYGIWNAASYFDGNVYIFGEYDYPKMFTLSNGLLPTTATSTGTIQMRGPAPIISANGKNNGIVWALQHDLPALRAWNPSDLTQEYYDTTQDPKRDQVSGSPVTRVDPLVANGRVYVPANGQVHVYGLLQ
jgi:hypothetical protein